LNLDLFFKYEETLKFLDSRAPFQPEIAIVLGSGLGNFVNSLPEGVSLETGEIPGYPVSTVAGHKGFIHFSTFSGKKLLIFQGRIHFYEGYSLSEVILPVVIAKHFNCKMLLLTNAAGGINTELSPGDLMINTDFYSLFIKKELARLVGVADVSAKNRFLDFPSGKIVDKIKEAAKNLKITIKEGSYYFTKGPSYETPAEIQMMKISGADAVGMSTVHEAIIATIFGINTGAISLITNYAAGISKEKLSHQEVIEAGKNAESKFSKLLMEFIRIV